MTVWIVNPFDNLPAEGFRPQRYWLMARAFARVGHRVVYWTSDFNHGTKEKRQMLKAEGDEVAFEVVPIPTLPYERNVCWARVRSHRRLARDFGRMARARSPEARPDLVIASLPPLGLCDMARRVAKSCGARFVCDIMDAWPETFVRLLPRGTKWLSRILFAPLRRTARRLFREADVVTGVSARYAEIAQRGDFHLAYHGIEAEPRVGAAPAPDGRPGTGTPRLHLVYLGNLGAGYDLETVVDAVARRPALTLDIAGLGPKEPALRAQVGRLGLDGRVRFHGYLATTDLQGLLARCDVGVIPLREDTWVGLPYKLCDYLQAGLPVLSSLAGECGAILERSGTGRTYASGDPDTLLRALDGLPGKPVSLPPELRAEEIYARYVEKVIP